ncbi:MAG: hypothetical protein Q9N02_06845 [Ghiorsea sp.]|nr:hypothetical protein [Ghiorsea sp.]
MKIQSTSNKLQLKKAQKNQTATTSFDSLLNAAQAETEQPIKHEADKQQQQPPANPQADLASQVQALEDTLSKLDDAQHNPEHIQQNIKDLRQALQQSKLHPQALEDADTILAVEAKRLEGLSRKTP